MKFEHVVIVRNPVSTHAERAEKYTDQLRAFFPDAEIVVLQTVRGGLEANTAQLAKHAKLFGPTTLLGVVAGDGTFNMIVTILANLGGQVAYTTLMPLWGGNANDLAHMLGGRAPRSLARVLGRAQTLSVRPLQCTLTLPNGQVQTRLAVCYASFGASAAAARRLGEKIRGDHPAHVIPGVRFIQEVGSVHRALRQAPTFDMVQEGGASVAFECTFLNGPRMAKITGIPLRLSDQRFHGIVVPRKSSSILLHAFRMRSRQAQRFGDDARFSFAVGDDIWAQFDGETLLVKSGTHLAVALAKQPLRLLAAKT